MTETEIGNGSGPRTRIFAFSLFLLSSEPLKFLMTGCVERILIFSRTNFNHCQPTTIQVQTLRTLFLHKHLVFLNREKKEKKKTRGNVNLTQAVLCWIWANRTNDFGLVFERFDCGRIMCGFATIHECHSDNCAGKRSISQQEQSKNIAFCWTKQSNKIHHVNAQLQQSSDATA